MPVDTYSFPTAIHFGPGASELLGVHLAERGLRRPLVVTDTGIAQLPFFLELVDALRVGGLEPAVFDSVAGNPTGSQVSAGVEAFDDHGADAIVGVGGGAALDVAKVIGLMATHDGELFDYENELPGARSVEDRLPWFVAVPTTAGTGSEVGRAAIIADDVTHVKRIVFSPHLLAKAVFADPALTVGLPASITAATGIDALTHNIEAYLAKQHHPICDGIALQGVRLVAGHLADAVADGTDIEARGGMLMASMMGAIAFQKGLGAVHSTAHALGTVADLHHGLANAIMIDHVLPFNVEAVPERFADLAVAARLDDTGPGALIDWLITLKADVGVPADLGSAGVDPGALEQLSRLAFDDTCHLNNPRPVTIEDLRVMFARAFP